MTDEPRYTDQQAAAIVARRFSVGLSAGAGCGKTFVLTQRFLSHLRPGPETLPLSSIVAITFTDRAAREMRDRVREACQSKLASCPAGEVDHWLEVLRGLDTARISTIHSFCTSLLRQGSVEAGLDPRFTVLEPPLAATFLDQATLDIVKTGIIADDPDTCPYVLRFGFERTCRLLGDLARQHFRIDGSTWQERTPEELADHWIACWQTVYVPRLAEELRRGAAIQRTKELLRTVVPRHPVMVERWGQLAEWLMSERPWDDPVATLNDIHAAARVQPATKADHWASPQEYEEVKETFTKLRKAIDDLREKLAIPKESTVLAAEFALRGMRLTRLVIERYEDLKREAGAVDFDDLLLKARELLRDHASVRERVRGGIRLLMVDEFQDTDPVQAEIVRSLCGEFLPRGRLFLVGDIKQSIYRFRRADPQVFQSLRQELPAAGQLSLTQNFRSQPQILDFVNALFHQAFAGYEPLVPFRDEQLSPVPAIEFLWATSDPEDDAVIANEKLSAAQLRRREANWIARRIVELLADPTPRVRDHDPASGQTVLRRVAPGDITILFRALSNVQEYEAALRDYGLDYYLVGGKAFFAQQEVFDLLNLCKVIDDPTDAVALIAVLRSPWFGLSDDTLGLLAPRDGNWWSVLLHPSSSGLPEEQWERVQFAASCLQGLCRRKDHESIALLLQDALDQTGYDAALLAEYLGTRKVANLRKLISLAEMFDRGEQFTLRDYIERLEQSVLEETDEEFATTLAESGPVIRLMTIHQSKGLEFPVVFVADVNRQSGFRSPSVYLHPEWGGLVKLPDQFGKSFEHLALKMVAFDEARAEDEETLRLLYVAVTRAADHLVLSAALDDDPKWTAWMLCIADVFDLSTGLPRVDPYLGTGLDTGGRIPVIKVHRGPPQAERTTARRDRPPLSQWRTHLFDAEPEPWPVLAQLQPRDPTAPGTWSVSALERVDERLVPPAVRAMGEPSATRLESAEDVGNLTHAALAHLDYERLDEWETAFAQARHEAGDAYADEIVEAARSMLASFARSAVAKDCATLTRRQVEVDFALPVGEDLVQGQIDLCGLRGDGTWQVLDFKTSRDPGREQDHAIITPYLFQLGVYALALESWSSQRVSVLSLILLRPRVRRIDVPFTAELRREIQQRLAAAIEGLRQEAGAWGVAQ